MIRSIATIAAVTLFTILPGTVWSQDAETADKPENETGTAAEAAPEPATPETPAEEVAAPENTARLAVFPFQTRPKIDTRVAGVMAVALTAALNETGLFTLLDRPEMANLSSELEFNRKDEIKTKSAAAWGAERDLDYVITGMVVAAGKGHGGMGIGGVRISSKAISLAVEVRVIDCKSGEAILEDTLKEEKLGLGLAVGTVDFDPESKKGSEMVSVVLRRIVRAILMTTFPPEVTEVDDAKQQVTLNYGAIVFTVDDRWELFAPAPSDDPKDKGQKLGEVRVVSIEGNQTRAQVIDGTAEMGAVALLDKAAE